MIRDKLTTELKRRIIEDIKITKDTGNERGFFLCENKEGRLIGSKSCEGTQCELQLGDPRKGCPPETATFGYFHTHPYIQEAKIELERRGEQIPSEDELRARFNKNIREVHEKITGVKGITISSPSYNPDMLLTLLNKYKGTTKGVVCTSTDVEPNKVECWTIKDMDKDKLQIYAAYGLKELRKAESEKSEFIEKWIDNISDREIIDLK